MEISRLSSSWQWPTFMMKEVSELSDLIMCVLDR